MTDANGEASHRCDRYGKRQLQNGTVTDIDGNYAFKVKRNAQLAISYLGYATQVVPAGTSKVVLKANDTKLNEVVVKVSVPRKR